MSVSRPDYSRVLCQNFESLNVPIAETCTRLISSACGFERLYVDAGGRFEEILYGDGNAHKPYLRIRR
jgi:hypothetical protein